MAFRPHSVALALCLLASHADAQSANGLRSDDARLNRRVTDERGYVTVAELLKAIATATGAPLSLRVAPEDAPALGVIALFKNRPAREVLAALDELLSSPDNDWQWRPAGDGYELRPERSLAAEGELARQRVRDEWAEDLRRLHRIAWLPRAQRDARLRQTDGFVGEDDLPLLEVLAHLSGEEIEAILAGKELELPPTAVASGAIASLPRTPRSGWSAEPGAAGGPDVISVAWQPGGFSPHLSVQLASGDRFRLRGDAAWLDIWIQRSLPAWSGPSDDVDLSSQPNANWWGAQPPAPGAPWLSQLRDLHTSLNAQLLLDVGSAERRTTDGWAYQFASAELVLAHLAGEQGLAWRKHGGLYLVRDPALAGRPRNAPPAFDARTVIQPAAAENHGVIPFDALAEAAAGDGGTVRALLDGEIVGLSPAQFDEWLAFFRFYQALTPAQRERLRSAEGLAWTAVPAAPRGRFEEAATGALRRLLDRWLLPEPAAGALQLRVTRDTSQPRAESTAELRLRYAGGAPQPVLTLDLPTYQAPADPAMGWWGGTTWGGAQQGAPNYSPPPAARSQAPDPALARTQLVLWFALIATLAVGLLAAFAWAMLRPGWEQRQASRRTGGTSGAPSTSDT